VRGETVGASEAATNAQRLRAAFDAVFAEPFRTDAAETVELLALRLGGDGFAIRLTETAGLFADPKVTPVPSPVAELRGLAGVRGVLVPVYDLAALMGYPPATQPRWLLTARHAQVGFAFEAFDGQLRVEAGALVAHEAAGETVSQVVRAAEFSGPIIQLNSLIAALARRDPQTASQREA
jgi:purine-binding chemotaxis protein CheW